jgi:hypothetical protein
MARPKRRRNAIAMAVSIALHAVVLTALALHAPRLTIPHEEAGPPEPIIPILIMPRTPPAPPGAPQPSPIRLHRRHLPHEAAPPTEAPFVAPKEIPTPREPPPASHAPVQPRITVQPSPGNQLTTALRGGLVGCANPQLLTPAERDRCMERLGRGAAQAPYIAPPLPPAKQAAFDRAAQAKARSRQGGVPVGVASPSSDSGASYRAKPDAPPPLPALRP